MEATDLDLDYVRRVGEDVRARLFPSPTKAGQPVYPLPVKLRYKAFDGTAEEIRFVVERTFQVSEPELDEASDVSPTSVLVVLAEDNFEVDLEFGREPEVPYNGEDSPDREAALVALLRAIAGVL